MTVDEWHASTSLVALLDACGLPEGSRKLRLFNAAAARRVLAVMPDDHARRLVDLAEQRADGLLADQDWLQAVVETLDPYLGNEAARDGAGGATFGVLMNLHQTDPRSILRLADSVIEARAFLAYTGGYPADVGVEEWVRRAMEAENADLCHIFRCVCGNPFRHVTLDSEWLTSTVRSLGEGINRERAFDRMPILADALQDAGCENVEVLKHCRQSSEHVRGCWVLDLVLTKP
jgi:hypothetical protein